MTALSTMLPNAGVAGRVLLRMLDECMRSDLEAALLVLAGMNLDLPGATSASSAVQLEERAKAAWLLDKAVKNYLVQAWRMRESQLGRAQVVRGNLAWLPSLDAGERTCKFLQRPDFEESYRHEWLEWRTKEIDQTWRKAHPRRNFFVVWTQHMTEVFYRWFDAKLFCRSERGAKMKGFDTLEDAYAAARSVQP